MACAIDPPSSMLGCFLGRCHQNTCIAAFVTRPTPKVTLILRPAEKATDFLRPFISVYLHQGS